MTLLFSIILCFQNVDAFSTKFNLRTETECPQLKKNLIFSFAFCYLIGILYLFARIQHNPIVLDPMYFGNPKNMNPSDFASSSKRTLDQTDFNGQQQLTDSQHPQYEQDTITHTPKKLCDELWNMNIV